MLRSRFIPGFVLAMLLLPLHAGAQDVPKPVDEEEARTLYAWYDGLGADAAEALESLADGRAGKPRCGMVDFSAPLDDMATAFLAARKARQEGREKDARGHLDRVSAIRASNWWEKDESLRHILETSFGTGILHWAQSRLLDPAVPRKDVVPLFRLVARAFPGYTESKSSARAADVLARMATEDASHREPPGWPDVPVADQVREWAWRLRDQDGEQSTHPGSCDIFRSFSEFAVSDSAGRPVKGDSPAHHLVRLGRNAVPTLVAAWDDDRLTRAADFDLFYSRTGRVLTIGDAARQVLAKIAGRSFADREEAATWSRTLTGTSVELLLAEEVRSGESDSPGQAATLAKTSPRAAIDALVVGIGRCKDATVRGHLVSVLGSIDGDSQVPALLAEAAESPSLPARVAASSALWRRGLPEGVASMIRTWKAATPDSDPEEMLRFLASCGDVGALRSMGESLSLRPVHWRVLAVEGIHVAIERAPKASPFSPEWRREAGRFLAGLLHDREVWLNSGGRSIFELSYSDPRVCDAAAAVLGRMQGNPKAIDFNDSLLQRNLACARVGNDWPQGQGIESRLESPLRPIPPPGPAVAPLLATAVSDADSKARDAALAALRKEGLPALSSVEKAIADLPAGSPARDGLVQLARDLAVTVREATVDADGMEPPESVRAILRDMSGTPFRSSMATALLIETFRVLPADARGLDIHLERHEDGSGVALRLKVLRPDWIDPSRKPAFLPKGVGTGWWLYVAGHRNGEMLDSGNGPFRFTRTGGGVQLHADDWRYRIERLEKAMEAGPTESIEWSLRLKRD